MTERNALRAEAAKARAASGGQRAALPCGEAKREDVKFRSEFRAELVQKNGQDFYLIEGYASMTGKPYEMWDMFGPYEETVAKEAFDETLAANPMVIFRFNHGGTSMANTKNGRLELWADSLGLGDRAWINPQRDDVQLLIHAIEDGDVEEQSFMFMIEDGEWSDDFATYQINKVNLDRGDVGPVTYGANPNTIIAARAGQLLASIPDLPTLAAREAYTLLGQRRDVAPPKPPEPPSNNGTGKSVRLHLASLEIDKQHQ